MLPNKVPVPDALLLSDSRHSCTPMSARLLILTLLLGTQGLGFAAEPVSLGPRPLHLVDRLDDSPLKTALLSCAGQPQQPNRFSIAHRGAPLQFPEHTREGYIAAARMGAGIIECDVTFTRDQTLVCRHSQCDLHTSTNILQTELATKCTVPPDPASATPFKNVKCCTSDLSLAEFKSLRGKMDSGDSSAATLPDYLQSTASYRTDLYATSGTLMTHRESIALFKKLGVQMIPELKKPEVVMPYKGSFSQHDYAQAMIDDYIDAGVKPENVYPQSFDLEDIRYWISRTPEFGRQATWLDGRYQNSDFAINKPSTWKPGMQDLSDEGIGILAPPLWMLLTLNEQGELIPSDYALAARAAGLELITWTLERSGPLNSGGGWYYQSIKPAISDDSDIIRVMDVLAQQVGVSGIFSDWPATTTYYANCLQPGG